MKNLATDDTANGGGIGIFGATFIVFLILKLTGVIAWSWWWVTAPLWIPLVLLLTFVIIAFLFAFVAVLFGKRTYSYSRTMRWR